MKYFEITYTYSHMGKDIVETVRVPESAFTNRPITVRDDGYITIYNGYGFTTRPTDYLYFKKGYPTYEQQVALIEHLNSELGAGLPLPPEE